MVPGSRGATAQRVSIKVTGVGLNLIQVKKYFSFPRSGNKIKRSVEFYLEK